MSEEDDGRSRAKYPCRACNFGHDLSCEDQRCECCGRGWIETVAAAVHQAYLDTCDRLGWPVKPENNVGYDDLSEESKDLDRATAQAAIDAALASSGVVAREKFEQAFHATAEANRERDRAEQAERERDRLREALRDIAAQEDPQATAPIFQAKNVLARRARAVLEGRESP